MKQGQIQEQMIAAQLKAAVDDQDFQIYLNMSYAPAQLASIRSSPTLATLHHVFLAGIEIGKVRSEAPKGRRMKTPGIMRTRH